MIDLEKYRKRRYKFVDKHEKGYTYFFYNDEEQVSRELRDKIFAALGYEEDCDILVMFLQIPHIAKADIMELFACLFLSPNYFARFETDEMMIYTFKIDKLGDDYLQTPRPTYISEYVEIIGQLFLAGYVDFLCECDDDYDRIDYPTNLSYYKEDKYQAWVYFRDNYFYKNAYLRFSPYEDIYIYDGKEYSYEDCPSGETINEYGEKSTQLLGYSTMYSDTSWDTPKYWSQYNILTAITPKGKEYLEILESKIYEKYKDLEVEISRNGKILRWFGEINRN